MNSLSEVEDFLNSLINYEVAFPLGGERDRPKLAQVLAAASRLDLPLVLPNCFHIAGTVGKGSTAAFAQALLSQHHSVLNFTSPHLVSFTERVQQNGADLPHELWCEGMQFLRTELSRDPEIRLTYFETMFAFYLWAAKKLGTTAHVVETGLGGSFDASNVLQNTTAIFTKIDFDHTEILGKTLSEIAKDKSGIIKSQALVFSVPQEDEAARELMLAAEKHSARLHIVGAAPADLALPFEAEYQRENFGVALAAVSSVDRTLTKDDVRTAIKRISLEARQQYLPKHPNILVDTCHNPASFRELARALERPHQFERTIALVAMMKDKDARASLSELRNAVSELWLTEAPTPRTRSANELAEIARDLGFEPKIMKREVACQEFLNLSSDTRGVVCGSFYLAGDFLKSLRNA
ncbi:MAG: hypothetical protein H6506_03755 [Calditrichaeota bacterium]|nr:hypothetical protein [Calditrichota bacterium]MCB9391748.1 hypothetical protein [Calditrichota bacterium]